MREIVLEACRVSHTYGSGAAVMSALDDVSVGFEPGKVHLITGPSGSGKTTLLSILGGILTPSSGDVRLAGHDLAGLSESERTSLRGRHFGFVFQAFRLLRSLTAQENVLVALQIAGRPLREARAIARQALAAVGLDRSRARYPHQLSGGEKQRVAVARALVNDPDVILADEPTASLDAPNGMRIAAMLRSIAEKQHRAVVIVSHDPRLRSYADRVIELQHGRVSADTADDSHRRAV